MENKDGLVPARITLAKTLIEEILSDMAIFQQLTKR